MEVKWIASASLMTLTMYEAAAGDTGGTCLEVSVYNQPHGLYTCICAFVHVCVLLTIIKCTHTHIIIACVLGSGCNVCKCVFHNLSDENVIL